MSADLESAVLHAARALIAEGGKDAVTVAAVAERLGCNEADIRACVDTDRELRVRLAVDFYNSAAAPGNEGITHARDAEAVLAAFLRGYIGYCVDHLGTFRGLFLNHFAGPTFEKADLPRIRPSNDILLGSTAARLEQEWGSGELPHGIHPRRLVFASHLAALGLLLMKSLTEPYDDKLKHTDDDLINELAAALAAPTTMLKQLEALAEISMKLGQLRTQQALVDAVPALLREGLGFEDAKLHIDEEHRSPPSPAVAVPVSVSGKRVGTLIAHPREGQQIDKRDLSRLEMFANMLGLALDNAQFIERLQAARHASQRFVPSDFLRLLGRIDIIEVERGDAVELEMGILFADVRGFTTRSEGRSPRDNFAFVNRYLERVEPAIVAAGGFIHQYLGDGIVALFPDDGIGAAKAAVEMQRAARELSEVLITEGEDPLRVGIGVNLGRVMIGTIGGERQLDAGVVGDAVNLCARIESLTKLYGVPVLISGAIAKVLRSDASRLIDTVVVKGRATPVELHELLEALDETARGTRDCGAYASALAQYRHGEFECARELFKALADADPAAAYMSGRSTAFAKAPPPQWHGVSPLDSE